MALKRANLGSLPVLIDAATGYVGGLGPLRLRAMTRLDVDDTAEVTGEAGQTLPTLKGSALASDLAEILIVPHSATDEIYIGMDGDNMAAATSCIVPAGGLNIAIGKTDADSIKLFSAASAAVSLFEFA